MDHKHSIIKGLHRICYTIDHKHSIIKGLHHICYTIGHNIRKFVYTFITLPPSGYLPTRKSSILKGDRIIFMPM